MLHGEHITRSTPTHLTQKKRIYDLAKQYGMSGPDLAKIAQMLLSHGGQIVDSATVAMFVRTQDPSLSSRALGVSRKGFIDTVVDDFLRQMVRTAGVGVHAWPFADRVQAGQHFNLFGAVAAVVAGCHRELGFSEATRSLAGRCERRDGSE